MTIITTCLCLFVRGFSFFFLPSNGCSFGCRWILPSYGPRHVFSLLLSPLNRHALPRQRARIDFVGITRLSLSTGKTLTPPGGGRGRPRPCSLLRCSARTEGAQRQVDWRVAVTDGQSAAHGRRLCVSEPGRLAKQLMSLMLH